MRPLRPIGCILPRLPSIDGILGLRLCSVAFVRAGLMTEETLTTCGSLEGAACAMCHSENYGSAKNLVELHERAVYHQR
jgi:hypothetical protein